MNWANKPIRGSLVAGSAFFALVFDATVIVVVLWQLRSGAVALHEGVDCEWQTNNGY